MKADFTPLQSTIDALVAQVAATEGVERSAAVLIRGFAAAASQAITDALTADSAATQTSILAANLALKTVADRYVQSAADLGTAITETPGTLGVLPDTPGVLPTPPPEGIPRV